LGCWVLSLFLCVLGENQWRERAAINKRFCRRGCVHQSRNRGRHVDIKTDLVCDDTSWLNARAADEKRDRDVGVVGLALEHWHSEFTQMKTMIYIRRGQAYK
jgi:hypothetical protein